MTERSSAPPSKAGPAATRDEAGAPQDAVGPTSPTGGSAVAHELDAAGLSCPMPVIELAKAIEHIAIGQMIAITATDPAARVDIPVWCRMQRHLLRGMEGTDHSWRFLVERAR